MRYVVKLSEQEELNLRQLTAQPGFSVALKLIQGEAFEAQQKAMECEEVDPIKRSLALTEAQCTTRLANSLIAKLCAYAQLPPPSDEETVLDDPLNFSFFERPAN